MSSPAIPTAAQAEIRTEEIKVAAGQSKKLMEFFEQAASTRLAVACFGIWKFTELGLATMESEWRFALGCFVLSCLCILVYMWSETRVRESTVLASGKKEPPAAA